MKNDQLDMFDAFTVEERYELDKIKELESQMGNLRKGFFKRYKEQNERVQKIENMFADLLEMIHYYEEKQLAFERQELKLIS